MNPLAAEWIEFVKGPSANGGYSAQMLEAADIHVAAQHIISKHGVAPKAPEQRHFKQAEVMLSKFPKLFKMKCGKVPPPWDIPAELWSMLLPPDDIQRPGRTGMGYATRVHCHTSAQAADLSPAWFNQAFIHPEVRHRQGKQ